MTHPRRLGSRSAGLLALLLRTPRLLVVLGVLALLLAGAFLPGAAGAALLLVLAALLGWLAWVTWPALPPGGRAGRVAAVGVLVVLAGSKVL